MDIVNQISARAAQLLDQWSRDCYYNYVTVQDSIMSMKYNRSTMAL